MWLWRTFVRMWSALIINRTKTTSNCHHLSLTPTTTGMAPQSTTGQLLKCWRRKWMADCRPIRPARQVSCDVSRQIVFCDRCRLPQLLFESSVMMNPNLRKKMKMEKTKEETAMPTRFWWNSLADSSVLASLWERKYIIQPQQLNFLFSVVCWSRAFAWFAVAPKAAQGWSSRCRNRRSPFSSRRRQAGARNRSQCRRRKIISGKRGCREKMTGNGWREDWTDDCDDNWTHVAIVGSLCTQSGSIYDS